MKAIWKVLMGAAAVAAVAPYSVVKDEETGEVKLKAATWSAKYTRTDEGPSLNVKLLPVLAKKDECCCEDAECCCCEEGPAPENEDADGITIEVEASETTEADAPEADDIPGDDARPEEA